MLSISVSIAQLILHHTITTRRAWRAFTGRIGATRTREPRNNVTFYPPHLNARGLCYEILVCLIDNPIHIQTPHVAG